MLVLYGNALSQPTRAVRLLLTANDIEHEFRSVRIRENEQRSAEFLRLNPAGKVPVIDDKGFVLSEAAAVLTYICESRGLEDWLPSDDLKARAQINRWLHWTHTNVRLATMAIFAPMLMGTKTSKGGLDRFSAALDQLEQQLQAEQFVAGSRSIADLFLLTELDQLAICELWNLSKYPAIERWLTRMSKTRTYSENTKPLHSLHAKLRKSRL
eukprot:Plantae.Rhodophyta-Purpureofilum_apyrenoidigerum.ctg26139.p1 GENE.Plantae.Rhodophyta-Purpureofilum_apyrenoidigerum.ctg26139~~Plantae.Rhodophyta-Purpureofilum_apyrenoidigerum.ctg26139.p1  ORF type:complete len:212 (+),score=31.17 Plantae.Rhodophyta-Purpureofilum_apyrenoidigerum.ctg26139:239-874(+)